MFTARITRKVGEEIVKEEIRSIDLYYIYDKISAYSEHEILEIHIIRKAEFNAETFKEITGLK